MPLDIQVRNSKDVTILDLKGKIILGAESASLREAIRNLLGEGKKKVLLNLGNVSFIDSAGVGTLVASFTTARAAGGEMKLSKLTQKFRETLQVTRLLTVFETYDDEAEAIRQFQ
ncbi:MAG: STAS domain-containing protein [Candidatus Acidiferrales bacterium]